MYKETIHTVVRRNSTYVLFLCVEIVCTVSSYVETVHTISLYVEMLRIVSMYEEMV